MVATSDNTAFDESTFMHKINTHLRRTDGNKHGRFHVGHWLVGAT